MSDTEEPLDRFRYSLLIVEDIPSIAVKLRNAVKKECASKLWLDIAVAATADEAMKVLTSTVVPFMSLDQQIPKTEHHEPDDELGREVLRRAKQHQPFLQSTILTGRQIKISSVYPGKPLSNVHFDREDAIYEKRNLAGAREYATILVQRINDFQRRVIWKKAVEELPRPLAMLSDDVRQHLESRREDTSRAAMYMFTTGLHLAFLVFARLASEGADPKTAKMFRHIHGPLNTGTIAKHFEGFRDLATSYLGSMSFGFARREFSKFFGQYQFLRATKECHMLRNRWAHDYSCAYLDDNLSAFVTYLLSMSFWALHPLVTDLRVDAIERRNMLRATQIKGLRNVGPEVVYEWDKELFLKQSHVYQVICDPDSEHEAKILSMHPLIRIEPSKDGRTLWLAHNPIKDEYVNPCNPSDETLRTFDDRALSEWWRTQRQVAEFGDLLRKSPARALVRRDDDDGWGSKVEAPPALPATVTCFDVFLSHNTKDKELVRELGDELRKRGLKVWLDESELQPGLSWMDALEEIITICRSAAVCLGENGIGPWVEPEMRALLRRFIDEKAAGNVVPVIPVLLPGAPDDVKLPVFLSAFTWVDLRGGLTDAGLNRLVWGITGAKPSA